MKSRDANINAFFDSQNIASKTMAKSQTTGRTGVTKTRVQVLNQVTNRWVKLDTNTGRIVDHKKSPGPYKGIIKKR